MVRVVDEVRREVAAVKLHTFNNFEFVVQALAVFNSDNAFLADFFHGFGNDVANFMIGVSRNSANLSNFLAGSCRLAEGVELFDGSGNSFVDTALQIHRAHTGGQHTSCLRQR